MEAGVPPRQKIDATQRSQPLLTVTLLPMVVAATKTWCARQSFSPSHYGLSREPREKESLHGACQSESSLNSLKPNNHDAVQLEGLGKTGD